jgi:hypothetical protein
VFAEYDAMKAELRELQEALRQVCERADDLRMATVGNVTNAQNRLFDAAAAAGRLAASSEEPG